VNPFTNASIVQKNSYTENTLPRGHKDFVMSRSELIEFNKCPSRWVKGFREDDTDSTDWGTLIDAIVSGQTERIAVCPATYPATVKGVEVQKPWNRNATYCQEWEQNAKTLGSEPVKSGEWMAATQAVENLNADPDIAEMVRVSGKQVLIQAEYRDRATGLSVPVRGMLDLLPPIDSRFGKVIADLKTCVNASPSIWPRVCFQRGYHIQGAMYLDLYTAATNEDRCEFWHILQENFAPYETGKRILSQEFIDLGRQSYLQMLKRYCRCLKSGNWPAYDDEGLTGEVIVNGWRVTSPEAWMMESMMVPQSQEQPSNQPENEMEFEVTP
jgi:hypothetical protein